MTVHTVPAAVQVTGSVPLRRGAGWAWSAGRPLLAVAGQALTTTDLTCAARGLALLHGNSVRKTLFDTVIYSKECT